MEKRHSRKLTLFVFSLSLVLMIGILLPGSGYSQAQPAQKRTVAAGRGGEDQRRDPQPQRRDVCLARHVPHGYGRCIDRHHQDQDRAKGPLPRAQAL